MQSRVEVDNVHSRAIDAALKAGNVSLGLKLGQLRDDHPFVIDVNADIPLVQVNFYARADGCFWFRGRGANGNGTVEVNFVWH